MKNLFLAFLLVAACRTNDNSISGGASVERESIYGGFHVSAHSLDAIGSIGQRDGSGAFTQWCAATLISPTTVVTAKHCTMRFGDVDDPRTYGKFVNEYRIWFALGADMRAPTRFIEAVAADVAQPLAGGYGDFGSDVAVYHLITPVSDVAPIALAEYGLTDADIGSKFVTAGFGPKNDLQAWGEQPSDGSLTVGTVTLNALRGNANDLMFGNYERYLEFMQWRFPWELDGKSDAERRAEYEKGALLDGYQAWLGNQPGDAQPTYTDSGAPLFRIRQDGALELYGVLSVTTSSRDSESAYGAFYAIFADTTRSFLRQAAPWTDPCAGVDGSVCDGTIAKRCSAKMEGDRALFALDCAALGQTCVVEDASAACR